MGSRYKYFLLIIILIISVFSLFLIKSDIISNVFKVEHSGDSICTYECNSYVNITLLRRPSVGDWNNFKIGMSFDNLNTPDDDNFTSYSNIISNWINQSFPSRIRFEISEYIGKSCQNITHIATNENMEEYEVTEETCIDLTKPINLSSIRDRPLVAGTKIPLLIKGYKENSKDTIKWGFYFGDAYLDPYWNSLFGFNYMSSAIATDEHLDAAAEHTGIRFKIIADTSTINVTNIYVLANRQGTSPVYNIGIREESSGNPTSNWMGTSNNAKCTIQPLSTGASLVGCNLGENVTLNNNTLYWLVINYSSGTINAANQMRVYTVDNQGATGVNSLGGAYVYNLEERRIEYYTSPDNDGPWTENTDNGPQFVLNYQISNDNYPQYGNPYSGVNYFEASGSYIIAQVFQTESNLNVVNISLETSETGVPPCYGEVVLLNITRPTGAGNWSNYRIGSCLIPSTWSGTAVRTCTLGTGSGVNLTTGNNYTIMLRDANNTCTPETNTIGGYVMSAANNAFTQLLTYQGNLSYFTFSYDNGTTWSDNNYRDWAFGFTYTILTPPSPQFNNSFVDPTPLSNWTPYNWIYFNMSFNQTCGTGGDELKVEVDGSNNSVCSNCPTSSPDYYQYNKTDLTDGNHSYGFWCNGIKWDTNWTITETNSNYISVNASGPTRQDSQILAVNCSAYAPSGVKNLSLWADFNNIKYNFTLVNSTSFGGINSSVLYNFTHNTGSINDTYYYKCMVESNAGNFKNSSENSTMIGKSKVYFVHAIDTETNNRESEDGEFEMELGLSNYNITDYINYDDITNGVTIKLFNNTRRQQNNDSDGNPFKLTWYMMTHEAHGHSTNLEGMVIPMTYNIIADIMYGNNTDLYFNYNGYYSNLTDYWNDSYGWHNHHSYWNGSYWVGALSSEFFFNGTELYYNSTINETDYLRAEKLVSLFAYENALSWTSFRAGWLQTGSGENNINYLNFLGNNTALDFTYSPLSTENFWEVTRNKSTNGQLIGFRCSGGPPTVNQIDNAFKYALNGTSVVVCSYSHNYAGNSILNDISTSNTLLKNASDWYDVDFEYATDLEAAQAFYRITDTTSPTVSIGFDGDLVIADFNEPLYMYPSITLLTTNGTTTPYRLFYMTKYNETRYTYNKSVWSDVTLGYRVRGTDKGFNVVTSLLLGTYIDIIQPTIDLPAQVTYPENITIRFRYYQLGDEKNGGVNLVNITIGDSLCPNTTIMSYTSGAWEVNCSVPDLSGIQNLIVNANTTGSNATGTEYGAVVYGQTYTQTITGPFTLSTMITRLGNFTKKLIIPFTFSGLINKASLFLDSVIQSLSFNSILLRIKGLGITITQSLTFFGLVGKLLIALIKPITSFTLNNDADVNLLAKRTATDSLSFTGNVYESSIGIRLNYLQISMYNQINKLFGGTRMIQDSLSLDELTKKSQLFLRLVSQPMTFSEVLNKLGAFLRNILQSLGFNHQIISDPDLYLLDIIQPNTTSPELVTENENITIYFNFTKFDSPITDNVNVTNITIGGNECTILGGSSYSYQTTTYNSTYFLDDAALLSTQADSESGAYDSLDILSRADTGGKEHLILKINISSIPDTNFYSAKLCFFVIINFLDSGEIIYSNISLINNSFKIDGGLEWDEGNSTSFTLADNGEITYNKRPTSNNLSNYSSLEFTIQDPPADNYFCYDISTAFIQAKTENYQNLSLFINNSDNGETETADYVEVYSKEISNSNYRPYLNVTNYTIISGGGQQLAYNSGTGLWGVNCTVPAGSGLNDLYLEANYTTDNIFRTDIEEDSITYSIINTRNIIFSLLFTDSLQKKLFGNRISQLPLISSLSLSKLGIFGRINLLNANLDEIINRFSLVNRLLNQQLSIILNSIRNILGMRVNTQQIDLSDSILSRGFLSRVNINSLSFSGMIGKQFFGKRLISEDINFFGLLQRLFYAPRNIYQQLTFSEYLNVTNITYTGILYNRNVTQGFGFLSDITTLKLNVRIPILDLGLDSLIEKSGIFMRNLIDYLTLSLEILSSYKEYVPWGGGSTGYKTCYYLADNYSCIPYQTSTECPIGYMDSLEQCESYKKNGGRLVVNINKYLNSIAKKIAPEHIGLMKTILLVFVLVVTFLPIIILIKLKNRKRIKPKW